MTTYTIAELRSTFPACMDFLGTAYMQLYRRKPGQVGSGRRIGYTRADLRVAVVRRLIADAFGMPAGRGLPRRIDTLIETAPWAPHLRLTLGISGSLLVTIPDKLWTELAYHHEEPASPTRPNTPGQDPATDPHAYPP